MHKIQIHVVQTQVCEAHIHVDFDILWFVKIVVPVICQSPIINHKTAEIRSILARKHEIDRTKTEYTDV